MKIRIVEKVPNFCVDVKLGQKRKGWIRVRFRSLDDHSCSSCVFSRPCCKTLDPICSKIISEVTAQGFYVITPPHFNLAINNEN